MPATYQLAEAEREIDRLRAINAELVAALEAMVEESEALISALLGSGQPVDVSRVENKDRARAALTKAKGE